VWWSNGGWKTGLLYGGKSIVLKDLLYSETSRLGIGTSEGEFQLKVTVQVTLRELDGDGVRRPNRFRSSVSSRWRRSSRNEASST
jgi:hypothetical protein